MVITASIRAHFFYWLFRLGPILSLFLAYIAHPSWPLIFAYILLAFLWYRSIIMILHGCGMDRILFGIELLTDMDAGI